MYLRRTATLVVLWFFASLSLHAAEPEPTVIALFGDSITVGFNIRFRDRNHSGTTERGCPTIYLTHLLNNLGQRGEGSCETTLYSSPIFDANNEIRNTIVASWGRGGTNTSAGVQRISENLTSTQNEHPGKAYLVLILYGTNDQSFGISTSTTGFNMRMMIQKAREVGYTPIIGTLLPRDDRDVSPYNAEIVAAANDEGAFVVDHYSRFLLQAEGWTTLLDQEVLSDGSMVRLHPNNHGYLVIAETWFDKRLRDIIAAESNIVISPILNLLLDE